MSRSLSTAFLITLMLAAPPSFSATRPSAPCSSFLNQTNFRRGVLVTIAAGYLGVIASSLSTAHNVRVQKSLEEQAALYQGLTVVSTEGWRSRDIYTSGYAPAFWRRKLLHQHAANVLLEFFVEDGKRLPPLREKADELKIPIESTESLGRFLGLHPDSWKGYFLDNASFGLATPSGEHYMQVADARTARLLSGPLFYDTYSRMDKLAAKWLELQYLQDKTHYPSISFWELEIRLSMRSEEIAFLQKAKKQLEDNGGKIPFFKASFIANSDSGFGTVLRYQLPATVFQNGRLLAWLKIQEPISIGPHLIYKIGSPSSGESRSSFETIKSPSQLVEILDTRIEEGKVSWIAHSNMATTTAHRHHLDNILADTVNQRVKENPLATAEEIIESILSDIQR